MLLQSLSNKVKDLEKLEVSNIHTWCSGCGNFGIINALKRALVLENIDANQTIFCYDVGCSGNESDKIGAYTIHGLHGRVLPLAGGIGLANPNLKVIAQAGDGATFSEGVNHVVHSVRNNFDLTFVVHNNENYGLTIGQASSTTQMGTKMSGTEGAVIVPSLNTLDFVLSLKPTFVARGFSGDVLEMTKIIQKALTHKGFSYVEILQSCPTFNHQTPEKYYRDRVFYVDENYDSSDIWEARKLVSDQEKVACGVLYQDQTRNDYYSELKSSLDLSYTPARNLDHVDVSAEFASFK